LGREVEAEELFRSSSFLTKDLQNDVTVGFVIPAKAGIQAGRRRIDLDSGFRRND